jgi:hypothetical protein
MADEVIRSGVPRVKQLGSRSGTLIEDSEARCKATISALTNSPVSFPKMLR